MDDNEKEGEYEKHQKEMLDEFIKRGNVKLFKRLINERRKTKKTTKLFLSQGYLRPSTLPKKEKTQSFSYSKYIHTSIRETTLKNDETFISNRNMFFYGIEKKRNIIKGNSKWGAQKFALMKRNWAKRKGIAFDEFIVPKYLNFRTSKNKKDDIKGNSLKLPKIDNHLI